MTAIEWVRITRFRVMPEMFDGVFQDAIDGVGTGSIDPNIGQCFDCDHSAMSTAIEVSHDDFYIGIPSCKESRVIGISLHLEPSRFVVCIGAPAMLQNDEIKSARRLGDMTHAGIGGMIGRF